MMRALRLRQPGAPLSRIFAWYAWHMLTFLWFIPAYGYRAWGVHNIPRTGPVMLVCNHQSFLDPIVVGLGGHHRQFYALARATLFHNRALAWLIRLLNAIPVDQEAADTAAMRRCITVLNEGHALLIFPEGSRTLTGKTETFEPGTMLLIKRAKPVVVPVALEGPFHAWPRGRKRPRLTGRIGVIYGKPIPAEDLLARKPADALEHLRQHIEAMRLELADRLARE